jgi:hypothetical protein
MELLNPYIELKKKLTERLLLKRYEVEIHKSIPNMSQGPLNPGFRVVRVENGDFLKKDSQDFKKYFQSGFLLNT